MIRYKFKYVLRVVVVFYFLLSVIACNPGGTDTTDNGQNNAPPTFQLSPQGQENTLEIATWNLENFPLNGSSSVQWISAIIQQLDIDLYAVQEIADVPAFQQMVDGLPEYEGLYSDDVYDSGEYQKTGIIYKRDMVTVLSREMLFTNDTYAFPRPPLLLHIDVEKGGTNFDFYLIVIHLKAYGDTESTDRRRAAALALKNYMDEKIANAAEEEKDYIVAGDWNDEIDDNAVENSFQVFIDVPQDYSFLTMPLAGDTQNASYPSWGSLIDHILISSDCYVEYANGTTRTLRLDDQVSSYSSYVSDHRPVMAIFPVF